LQVDAAHPADVAEPGAVELDDLAEVVGVAGEPGDMVVRGADVRRDALIPALLVDGQMVLHPRTVSHRRQARKRPG